MKITAFLKEGISPQKLSIAMALGITLGLIPLLGATSILCAAAAFAFRLNMPSVQLVNYIVYPLQLILYIPFLKTGTYLFSQEHFDYTLQNITEMLSENLWQTVSDFFWINVYGLLLWAILAPLLFAAVYFLTLPVFKKIEISFKKNPAKA